MRFGNLSLITDETVVLKDVIAGTEEVDASVAVCNAVLSYLVLAGLLEIYSNFAS